MLYDQQGLYEEAIQELEKVIAIIPRHGKVHADLAYLYGGKGMLVAGISELLRAIELHPNYHRLHYDLGLAYTDKGDYDLAIEEFRKAIEINGRCVFTYFNLGYICQCRGELQPAIKNYQKGLELFPNYYGYSLIGELYFQKNRFMESMEAFERAVELNPHCAKAYYYLGEILFNRQNLERAIIQWKKCQEVDTEGSWARKAQLHLGKTAISNAA
jgi:Flp pilus assembly protein TadD